ncbi:MAG: esterase-like activity of phytase family protein, partial [Candidatus Kapaibacteriota bacterium]
MHILTKQILLIFFLIMLSCSEDDNSVNPSINYPDKAIISKRDVILTTPNGVNVINGGYGSSLASIESGIFYALTDRGPNIDGANSNEKIFPKPDFVPQIGKFKLVGDKLELQKIILLKDETGRNLTGLPNPIGQGGTGETALDLNGNKLEFDPKGIDPEGLVVMRDGTFWVADEYGPHLIHFDANGKAIEWLNPFGTGIGGKKLPQVYKYRRPNRGMEGLTITPDGRYLVGIMQSPLLNPNKDVQKTSTACRILFYELATGAFKEYIYLLDTITTAISEITAITNNTFLVLERDGKTPGQSSNIIKKLYKIDISNATNVYSSDENGKLFNGKTIEQLTTNEINSLIKCVSKEEVLDIMSIPNYPHDK